MAPDPVVSPGEPPLQAEGAEAFLSALPDYTPTIPDALTEYYLQSSGMVDPGVHLTRLISLAAQRFVAGIAEEAHWYCEQRQQSTAKSKIEQGYDARDKRKVLTTEDLAAAMKEYGVDIKKPMYYADHLPGNSGRQSGH
mmetsp:Transcript_8687/g.16460  ORF Transcript_8687/g.16460 Transcript_8687/m.16460 type:complete len:139 (+) Transcript_8687:97-513(+)